MRMLVWGYFAYQLQVQFLPFSHAGNHLIAMDTAFSYAWKQNKPDSGKYQSLELADEWKSNQEEALESKFFLF